MYENCYCHAIILSSVIRVRVIHQSASLTLNVPANVVTQNDTKGSTNTDTDSTNTDTDSTYTDTDSTNTDTDYNN